MPPELAAAALPFALLVGVVAELVSALVRSFDPRERPWWGGVASLWRDGRRLLARREAASLVEAGGALAAFAGSGLAAAAAAGLAPGSAPFLYLSLLLGAAGVHVAAATPTTRTQDDRVRRLRLASALAEPAFVVALGAVFLRWGATRLEAVRGDQQILGPGISLAPPAAAAGLALAALVVLVAGAARLVPAAEARRGPGRPAGSALLVTLSRWAMLGATAIVAAAVVAGGEVPPRSLFEGLTMAGGVLACAVVVGLADGLFRAGPTARLVAVPALLVAASGAVALVVLG